MPAPNAITTAILDELLARRTVAGRPADLTTDDLAFIRAASGRASTPTHASHSSSDPEHLWPPTLGREPRCLVP